MSRPTNTSVVAREYLELGRSAGCPIIDMHGHFGHFGAQYLPASDAKTMVETLKKAGVKRIVCSSFEALFGDVALGNSLMQEAVDRHPNALAGYWVVNPNFPAAERSGSDFEKSHGFAGFKFLPDYHACPITGQGYVPALRYADERGLIVLAHTWGGSSFDSPQMLAEVAAQYPRATFIMGHSGYGDWETSVAAARALPNVYLDLTAVYVAHDFTMQPGGSGTPLPFLSCLHVNGIIEFMVAEAGSQKILFGTDMPWYSPYYAAGAVLFAEISEDARHDILHRNAEKLLRNLIPGI